MFVGTHRKHINDEGQVEIPVGYQPDFFGGGILTRGLGKCLYLYPKLEWKPLSEAIANLGMTNATARSFQRHMLSGVAEVSMDDGCITVPKELRDYADIHGIVIMSGVGTHVEMSNVEVWEKFLSSLKEPEDFASAFNDLALI